MDTSGTSPACVVCTSAPTRGPRALAVHPAVGTEPGAQDDVPGPSREGSSGHSARPTAPFARRTRRAARGPAVRPASRPCPAPSLTWKAPERRSPTPPGVRPPGRRGGQLPAAEAEPPLRALDISLGSPRPSSRLLGWGQERSRCCGGRRGRRPQGFGFPGRQGASLSLSPLQEFGAIIWSPQMAPPAQHRSVRCPFAVLTKTLSRE